MNIIIFIIFIIYLVFLKIILYYLKTAKEIYYNIRNIICILNKFYILENVIIDNLYFINL